MYIDLQNRFTTMLKDIIIFRLTEIGFNHLDDLNEDRLNFILETFNINFKEITNDCFHLEISGFKILECSINKNNINFSHNNEKLDKELLNCINLRINQLYYSQKKL